MKEYTVEIQRQPLIIATTAIHELKQRMDSEEVDIDVVVDSINSAMQVLTTITNKK